MRWPWLPPSPGDLAAIAIAVIIGIALVLGVVRIGGFRRFSNWGFGPDWNCIYVPQSDPVCFKHPPRSPAESAKPPN
jgi:hypothetical protein